MQTILSLRFLIQSHKYFQTLQCRPISEKINEEIFKGLVDPVK